MKAFEIHTYQSGKWKIDSVFDDRDLAMFEAQRMDSSGRYTSIRVVEEVYFEATKETKTRTIYRGSKVADANAAQLRKARETNLKTAQAPRKGRSDPVQRRKAAKRRKVKKQAGAARLIMIMIMIMITTFAGGAMYGLLLLQQGGF